MTLKKNLIQIKKKEVLKILISKEEKISKTLKIKYIPLKYFTLFKPIFY